MKIYTKSGPKISKGRVDISGALLQLSFCLHLSSSGNFIFAASQDIVKAF